MRAYQRALKTAQRQGLRQGGEAGGKQAMRQGCVTPLPPGVTGPAVSSHDDVVLNPNAGEGSQLLSSLVLPPELRTLRTADLVLWLDPLDATRSFVRPQLPSVFSSNFSDFRLSWVYLGRWIAGLPTSPP